MTTSSATGTVAAGLAMVGLLAAGCSATSRPAPTGADATVRTATVRTATVRTATVRTATMPGVIYGVRTSADDRSLVVGYEDGGCAISGRAKISQTPSVVTLTALVTFAVPGVGGGCPGDSRTRTFIARLARPLGHRRLIDGATHQPLVAFDGTTLLTATAPPAGLTVRTDLVAPGPRDGATESWTQSYRRRTPQADTQCADGGSPTVTVSQGRGIGTLRASSFLTRIPGRHEVDGASAQLFFESGFPGNTGLYDLRWNLANRPGRAVLVQVQQTCRRPDELTASQVMHFANDLREPGRVAH